MSNGYTHFRRLFSFRVTNNTSDSDNPHLPFARIYDKTLTWTDHDTQQSNLPIYLDIGGGGGAWTQITNAQGANHFKIPGNVPLVLQWLFAVNPISGVSGNKARLRSYLNSDSWPTANPADEENRNPNSLLLDFDNFAYTSGDIKTVDGSTAILEFADFTIPYTGNVWIRIHCKGYRETGEDFPIP